MTDVTNEKDKEEKNYQGLWIAEEQMRLASERTFLAWLRTGMTSTGLGIAIAKFLEFKNPFNATTGKLAGMLLIIWGISIFAFALSSYQRNCQTLHVFEAKKPAVQPLTIVTSILILITIVLLVIILE